MESKLCIYFCSSLIPEVSHLLRNGNYPDVTLKGYPANCSSGYASNEMILEMVGKRLNEFSKIMVFSNSEKEHPVTRSAMMARRTKPALL